MHHAATTGDRALIEALISRGAEAERDIFGLQPVDVLPIGSDHSAFGHQLESKSRGFQISVTSGMLEKNRSVFYFDIQVSVPQGRHGRLFVQVCHAVDGNYCLKRLPPLYKLIGATRLSTGGTRVTAAVISLRVTGVLRIESIVFFANERAAMLWLSAILCSSRKKRFCFKINAKIT